MSAAPLTPEEFRKLRVSLRLALIGGLLCLAWALAVVADAAWTAKPPAGEAAVQPRSPAAVVTASAVAASGGASPSVAAPGPDLAPPSTAASAASAAEVPTAEAPARGASAALAVGGGALIPKKPEASVPVADAAPIEVVQPSGTGADRAARGRDAEAKPTEGRSTVQGSIPHCRRSGWYVQAGAFEQEESLRKRRERVRAMGYPSCRVSLYRRPVEVLFVGPFENRAGAQKAKLRLVERLSDESLVVRHRGGH